MHSLPVRLDAAPAIAVISLAACFAVASYAGFGLWMLVAVAAVAAAAVLVTRPILALSLSIALMPLEAVGRVLPGVPALTWSKVALVACFAGLAAETLVRHDRMRVPAPIWALFGFIAVDLIGTWAGRFGYTTETWEGAAGSISSIALVILAVHYVRSERDFKIASLGVIAGSVPVVTFGIIEVVTKEALFPNPMFAERLWAPGATDLFRITSTFYDPNQLGRYLVFVLLWTIASIGMPSMRRWRTPLVLLAAAQAFCLVNTFSRAAFLTLLVVGAPFVVARVVRRWKGTGVAVIVVGAVLSVAALWRLLVVLVERFDDPTAGGRTNIAYDALFAILNSPLFGFGHEHTADAMGIIWGRPIAPHNLYLETVLAVGVVGLLFALAWMVPVLSKLLSAWSAGDVRAPVVTLPLLGVLFFGMSLHGLDGYELWIPFALALPAIALARGERTT